MKWKIVLANEKRKKSTHTHTHQVVKRFARSLANFVPNYCTYDMNGLVCELHARLCIFFYIVENDLLNDAK